MVRPQSALNRAKPRRLPLRSGLISLLILAALLALAFALGPGMVERRLNRVLESSRNAPSAAATALHRRLTIVDLHADTLLWGRDPLSRADRGHADVPRLIEGNVAVQAFTIVTKSPRGQNIEHNVDSSDNILLLALVQRWPMRTWSSLAERALYQAQRAIDAARESNGRLAVVRTVADLESYLALRKTDPNRVATFIGVEGAQALDGKLENLDRLFDGGVRMMAPTHFTDTDIGGSASGEHKGGLTPKGVALIARMEAKHMLVDLAHASPQTIDEVLAIATKPVVVSHTGVRGTCNNARNLSDDHILRIAKTGGVIGIGYWPHAVCDASVAGIVRAIRHVVRLAGVEHVALGSDFDGATTVPFDASGLAALTDGLLGAGFSERDVARIMGENSLRVLRGVLP